MKDTLRVTVKDHMNPEIMTVEKEENLLNAAKIMSKNKIGALVVLDDHMPIGMLTERDILHVFIDKDHDDKKVKEYMTTPLISINQNKRLGDAAQLMLSKNIRRLGVINENGKIIGFFNLRDLIKAVHNSFLAIFEV